jgi:hypothetical protein
MINFTPEQQEIIQSLINFKPKLTKGGKHIVLTTNELYRMEVREFIKLCQKEIPTERDLIAGLCIESGTASYLEKMYRKSLIHSLQHNYVTISLAEAKKKYPSFFRPNND